jgi:hypothetical protein
MLDQEGVAFVPQSEVTWMASADALRLRSK